MKISSPLNSAITLILLLWVLPSVSQTTLTLSTQSLPDFREVYPGHFSDVQFYHLTAEDPETKLIIRSPTGFKISLDCYDGFTDSLAINYEETGLTQTIYVRFFPEITGSFDGSISHYQAGDMFGEIEVSGRGIESLIPEGYYDTATGSGSELKTNLHSVISGHSVQTYASLWGHFTQTDATFDGYVWDIYSDTPCEEPPYIYVFGDDQDTGTGGHHNEGDVYNREHSMPRSWFGGAVDPMNTDLFHIFPVDKFVNAQRDNYPFGEVDDPFWTSLNGGRLGPNSAGSYTGTAFEPIDDYKGDLARAFFYMITRYEDRMPGWTYNENGNAMFDHNTYPGYRTWVIDMLLRWHEDDPVSQKEILRNHAVYQIQGNRNPFVDHPELVERIWGDTTVYAGIVQEREAVLHLYPNPAAGSVEVSLGEEIVLLEVYNIQGVLIKRLRPGANAYSLNLSGIPAGQYLLVAAGMGTLYREMLLVM